MVAGWAVQGVGDPQRGVGCQLCSRLAQGLLTQVVPALLTTSLQSPVWPEGAGSPLAQAWLSHAGTMACPWAPGSTAGGAAADAPALPLCSVGSAWANCWAQLGEPLFHRAQGWTPRSEAQRQCWGSTRLGEQSQRLGQRQFLS